MTYPDARVTKPGEALAATSAKPYANRFCGTPDGIEFVESMAKVQSNLFNLL
jgi:hypothetical protein